jgi:hydroxymethylpyrimidine pyrophosphatase-like HAD family hydrolase
MNAILRVVAFDLDGTLTESKSKIDQHMAGLLGELLARLDVCIITGGMFEQIEAQVLLYLNAPPRKLAHLHIIPTCGALLGMGKRRLTQALCGEPDRG